MSRNHRPPEKIEQYQQRYYHSTTAGKVTVTHKKWDNADKGKHNGLCMSRGCRTVREWIPLEEYRPKRWMGI